MRGITLASVIFAATAMWCSNIYAQCGGPACGLPKVCNLCKPKQAYKWVTQEREITVKVPVKRCIEEEVTVVVKEPRYVTRTIEVPSCTFETREIPCVVKKIVCVPETYTVYVNQVRFEEVTVMKKVARRVPVEIEKVICRIVKDVDPCTGCVTRRKVEETVKCTVYKTVYEDVECKVMKKVCDKVAVEKTRMVKKCIEEQATKTIKVKVPTTVTKEIQVCEYENVEKKVMQKRWVTECIEKTKVICEKVKVAVDPC